MKLSVIICAHNPRPDYLRRTLGALKEQTVSIKDWELLLIDNASDAALANIYDLSWHVNGRHIREDELGLTPSRVRGITESAASLLVFVDDDNILDPDYLEQTLHITQRYPNLGAFGAGILAPEFEAQPSPKVVPFLSRLALREVDSEAWSNDVSDDNIYPWGAGLVVKRKAALHWTRILERFNVNSILGRRGKHLFSGEDILFSWASVGLKEGFGIYPQLKIKHLMPAGRVQPNYLLRLLHDTAFSRAMRVFLLFGTKPNPIRPISIVPVLLRIRHGIFSMRCAWAERTGVAKASRFIKQNQISSFGINGIQA